MIRKFVIITGFYLISCAIYGQGKGSFNIPNYDRDFLHLGYYVGLNAMNFISEPRPGFQIDTKAGPGFCLGLATTFRLSKYLEINFLPGMIFGERDILIWDSLSSGYDEPDWHARIESVYIDIPLHLKYRAKRQDNFAPYIFCGIAPKFDIYGGEIIQWKRLMRLIKPFDYFPEIGFGIDFYLMKVKMSTELKFSVGQMNIYVPTIEQDAFRLFDDAIISMKSRMVSLTFNFLGR